jgi:hypothetical protein
VDRFRRTIIHEICTNLAHDVGTLIVRLETELDGAADDALGRDTQTDQELFSLSGLSAAMDEVAESTALRTVG